MSARKFEALSLQNRSVTVQARQTRLVLSPDAVVIHKGGIEFQSESPFPKWVEMTVALNSPTTDKRINCSGVVVDCTGNRHNGYHVSMVFTGLTKQAESRLSVIASSQMRQ